MKGPLQMLGLAGGLLHRTTFRRQSWLITRRNLKKLSRLWGVQHRACLRYNLAIDDDAKQYAIRRQTGSVQFDVVHPRPVNAILPGDLGFTATLQGRPFLGGHPIGNWPLHCAIGMICRVQEGEFLSILIKDGRELVWSIDSPKL